MNSCVRSPVETGRLVRGDGEGQIIARVVDLQSVRLVVIARTLAQRFLNLRSAVPIVQHFLDRGDR
jgi:hypothetical protein